MRRAFVLLLLASSAWAQKPPAIELGFSPERVYSFGGIDNVNAFNGNNVITLPLTLQYRVSNHLTYSLGSFYNSKAWDYRYYVDEFATGGYALWAKPNLRSNAGAGWRVSMGRLLAPDHYTHSGDYRDESHDWLYEGQSGSEHGFSSGVYPQGVHDPNATVQFTTDGSYLRMVVVDATTRRVQFPDGQVHTFTLERSVWRLTRIEDPFLNNVTVAYTYLTSNTSDSRVLQWTVNDSTGRQHTVRFQYFSDMADSFDRGMNVEYLEMAGVGSEPVRYTFGYTLTSVDFECHHSYRQSEQHPGAPAGDSTTFPLLTSITSPDDTAYDFSYYESTNLSCSQGLLQNLTLPTGGVISYGYQQYFLPPARKCDTSGPTESSVGIKTRTADGNTWQYLHTHGPQEQTTPPTSDPQFSCGTDETGTNIEPDPPTRWARTSILSPPDAGGARSRTDNYFSVHNGAGGTDRLQVSGLPVFYGEPMVIGWPGAADAASAFPPNDGSVLDETGADTPNSPSTTRVLSQQTWTGCDASGDCGTLLRSTYRRNADWTSDAFRQLISERTTFHDDTGCVDGETTCYVQTDWSDFDRVGHWRQAGTTSNFPGTSGGSSYTGYLSWTDAQLKSSVTKWLFTRYTETQRTIGAQTLTSAFCFDGDGLLLRTRALAGNTFGAHDLISEYAYTSGNVTEEKSYGGDAQTLDTTQADLCETPLSNPRYWNQYAYSSGVLASSQYTKPATSELLPFKSLDYTVDSGTGLVTASKATDGLSAGYAYKTWGALESVTPPGEATSTYVYTKATSSAFANVTMTRSDITTKYDYDRLGRHTRTEQTIPGAGCSEQVISYDALGRKSNESVWKSCGTSADATSYSYDAFGRPTSIMTADGKSTTISYKGVRIADRARTINTENTAVTTREESDVFGRLVRVTENLDTNPADGVTGEIAASYTYDADDRLIGVAIAGEGGSQTRTFSYDGRGLLLSESHPELGANGYGTTSYEYDARGHVRRKVTGTLDITMTYDDAERLTEVKETAGNRKLKDLVYDSFGGCVNPLCSGKLAAAARYHYDSDLGHPTTSELAVTESYQYDDSTGRAARRDRTVGSTSRFTGHSFYFTQSYNTLGAPDTTNYPCPSAGGCDHQLSVTNGYTNGLLTSVGSWVSTITYQPSGLIDTVTHGSGPTAVREIWTADPHKMQRPKSISVMNASNATLWSSGDYSYDGSGNIIRIGGADYTTYSYDPYGRLRGWTRTNSSGASASVAQAYDTFGNWLFNTLQGCGPASGGNPPICYSTGVLAEPVAGTTNHYSRKSYDDAGNLTADSAQSFSWDSLGVMTRAAVGGSDFRFLYTPDDERIAAVQRVTGGDGIVRNKTTYTIRDFANQLLNVWTVDPNTNALSWKEDAIRRGEHLVAREKSSGTTHYSVDHLGSPRAITSSTGLLVGTQEFAPFGSGGASDSGALQFTGHERDAANLADGAVGLPDYFHARYYDLNGRFLSVDAKLGDPVFPQSWNRYVYALNNPLKYVDPTGENAVVTCDERNNCVAAVEAQIIADPNDPAQMNVARDFQQAAQQYWNAQNVTGHNGENITFRVNIAIVAPGQQQAGMDTLQVVNGSGRTVVNMTLQAGGSPPDTGTIYTQDNSNNPSGMQGIAPHETGHLLGLRDMYVSGQPVPHDARATADIMRNAQPTNSPLTGFMMLSAANTNSVVHRVCFWGFC